MKKDAADLAAALQSAVDAMVGDQRIQQIFAKGSVTWRPV